MPRFALTLAIAAVFVSPVVGQSLTLDDLFPADRVLDVRITVGEQDWKMVRRQSRTLRTALDSRRKRGDFEKPYTYVEATVVIDGVEFPRVGVRKKGFIGSLSRSRPSLKVKLNYTDKKANIDGLTGLTFNNNKQDGSLCSQFLGYAMFNAAGCPAPRCAFARVTVNGSYLGIYSHVESARAPLLERGFGTADGTLYEGTVVDFFPGWDLGFERKFGDKERGHEQIERLIKVLGDEQEDEAAIARLVDLDSFYTFWALEGLLGYWDGYSGNKNNFFVYLHPQTRRFHFLPWGADHLFVKYSPLRRSRAGPISVKTTGLVAYRLYQLASGRRRYAETMERLLEEQWRESRLVAEIERIEALLEPHLGLTQRRAIDEMYELRDFIEDRRADIMAEIEGGMPIWDEKPDRPFVIPRAGAEREESIWSAASRGDVDALKKYVAKGVDVSVKGDDGTSPLALAALAGEVDAVRYLLEEGATVDAVNDKNHTALHAAAFFGQVEVAELLIENAADLDVLGTDGSTPLDSADGEWNSETARMVRWVGRLSGVKFDLEEVEANRPRVAALLRRHGARRGQDLDR